MFVLVSLLLYYSTISIKTYINIQKTEKYINFKDYIREYIGKSSICYLYDSFGSGQLDVH